MKLINSRTAIWALIISVTLLIFIIDLLTPLHVIGGIPYILPVLIALVLPPPRPIIFIATACSAFVALGLFVSLPEAEIWQAVTTRGLTILAIIATAVLGTQFIRHQQTNTESQAQLLLALNATNQGTWDWDLTSDEVRFDDSWCRAFGYEPNEIVHHRSFWETLVHPEDLPAANVQFQAHLAGDTPIYECKHRLRMKSGSWSWSLGRGKVVARDSYGKPTRMIGIDIDITAQQQAEQRQILQNMVLGKIVSGDSKIEVLNQLCTHIEQLVPSSVCSIMALDPETGTLNVEAAPKAFDSACSILNGLIPGEKAGGCGTAAYTGKAVIISDTETDPRWEPIREAARPLGIKSCWSIPIIAENTQVLGTFAISHTKPTDASSFDLSMLETASYLAGITFQQAKAKENLKTSEERFRDLYESAPLAYFTSDMEGNLINVNIRAQKLLGLSADELINRHVIDLYAPTTNGKIKAQRLHKQAQEGHEIIDEELEMQRADGTRAWINLTVRLIRDAKGHPIERRGMVQEIGTRKRVERLLDGQKTILEMIAVGQPLNTILERLCLIIEEQSPGIMCSVHLLEGLTLRNGAAPSLPESYFQRLDGLPIGPCAGSCGTAAYRKEPVIVSNIATDPLWERGHQLALKHGLHACWSTPIFSSDCSVLGTFAIYYDQPRVPGTNDFKLIDASTKLAGIAIERLNAVVALEQSEERYRTLYHDTPNMYFTVSPEYRVLSVNQFGAQQLGYTAEELIGQSVLSIYHEDDQPYVQNHLSECLRNRENLAQREFRKIKKDGRILWVHETARTICDSQGHPMLLIVCEDITERKLTEVALLESEQRFRSVIQSASEAVILSDRHGNITSWNNAAVTMFGYSEEFAKGKAMALIIPQRYWEAHKQGIQRVEATGESQISGKIIEAHGLRKNGDEFPLELSLSSWAIGTERYFCGIIRDVTDRKRIEEERRTSEQAIRELYEITSSSPETSFEQRIRALLELGSTRFNLPIGLLTQRQKDHLHILYVQSEHHFVEEGTEVPLCHTFCSTALTAEGPISFEHAKTSEWRLHPGYEALGLESYLGTKVMVGQKVYGTLCFTSPEPYPTVFTDADKDFLMLMARWVGNELERQYAEEALRENEHTIRKLHNITSSHGSTFEERVQALLKLGSERYHLTHGAFNEIHANQITWKILYGPGTDHASGTTHRLQDTLCQPVVDADEPVALAHIDEELLNAHPVGRQTHTKSYIGTTIKVGDNLYGTICFTGSTPRESPFTMVDKDFLQLMAQWLGAELERRHDEKALKEMNVALSHAMPGISKLDSTGRYTQVNRTYAEMLGYHATELLGQPWQKTVHTDDLKIPELAYQKMLAEGEAEFEARAARKDGSEFYKHVLLIKEVNNQGTHVGHHCLMRDITDRKRGEEALRESEERLQSILDNSSAVIYVKDLQDKYILINRTYETLFDLDRETVKGQTDFDLFPYEIAKAFTDNDQRVLQSGLTLEQEEVAPHNNELHTYLSNKFLLRNTQGVPYALCGISTDITKRKQVEEALQSIVEGTSSFASGDFFRSLVHHLAITLHVPYAFISECTDTTKTNVQTLAFVKNGQIVDNIAYATSGTPCQHVMQGETCVYLENLQSLFPFATHFTDLDVHSYVGVPLQDSSGSVIGHLVILHSQPFSFDGQTESMVKIFASRAAAELERHRINEALQKSEERYRSLVNHAPMCIHELDRDGRIQSLNAAGLQITHTEREEDLLGLRYPELAIPQDQPRLEGFLEQARQGISSEFDHRIIIDNIERIFSSSFIPIKDHNGYVRRLMGITQDITERKKAADELLSAYERTRDLTTRLEAAEESERKRIARELHDEFGQMLTGLKFDIAWVQRRLSEQSSSNGSEIITQKIRSMSKMTDDLIHTIRRIATSLRPSILDDLGLVPALEWQAKDFEKRTGVECQFTTSPDILTISFDNEHATALFRIAQELFTNITRYAEASRVNLDLRKKEHIVTLTVQDNGQGISEHEVSRLSSLGLLGIKERVAQFNGQFHLSGRDGNGTRATIHLPLSDSTKRL